MFLTPLLRDPEAGWLLVNDRTRAVLARRVVAAVDSAARRKGLLGRDTLADEALVIAPCNAIHTWFMRITIDVVYADREGRIVKCSPSVRPWRLSGTLRAFAAIELAEGTIARSGTAVGDQLRLEPQTGTQV
jgi:uncharacterized membrane protein (UPF0127 family)